MSYDLYFWKSAAGEPDEICDRLADEDVVPAPEVERFRTELLARWPDLADRISPWAPDLDWRQPWGRKDLADYFVSLTLPFSTEASALQDMVTLARKHDLVTHNPQTGETIR
ncbi:hypothetical protein [Actinomadura bangladeshensis]|uniref:Uncharacterized protein n=1 Tax=Actinomadura bangladeshensis TaxID=453573 RepID=A0A4R4NTH1_9ACTN|nr:hypothetical protein [Actinomadura bangladeshensis]TDC12284.1 hypothetical protein E1284_24345 [Actinomadura bangladeshensis]